MKLPKPPTPYKSWPLLIEAAVHHGMANMNPAALNTYARALVQDIMQTFSGRKFHSDRVRPSHGLNCSAIPWLIKAGHIPEPREPSRILLASGHFHHNLIYAALISALPQEGVSVLVESRIKLPGWWPKDKEVFNQRGTRDLLFEIKEDGWLLDTLPKKQVCDVKSKHALGMQRDGAVKKVIQPSEDIWGNGEQVALYSDGEGILDDGALILYTNRECPIAGGRKQYSCKLILPEHLLSFRDNARTRIEREFFYPELWLRQEDKGDYVYMPCRNYCDHSDMCETLRAEKSVEEWLEMNV